MGGEIRKRILSGVIMLALAAVVIWIGGVPFAVAMVLLWVGMTGEWLRLSQAVAGGVKTRRGALLALAGVVYLGVGCLAATDLRLSADGPGLLIWLVLVVVATDCGAYAAGRLIGGPRLAPKISPNKTWSGLAGGVGAAALCGAGLAGLAPEVGGGGNGDSNDDSAVAMAVVALAAALLALAAQGGDLLESRLKRLAGVKDSGRLIPGHGGLLDRMDGYLAALPCLWLWLALLSRSGAG